MPNPPSANTVSVKCKPYVAHYLRLKYQLRGNIIDLPRKSKLRATFLSCLQKNFTESDNEQKGFSDEIQIFICDNLVRNHSNKLGESFYALFNNAIEEKIKTEAFHIINLIRIKHKMKPKQAILEFQSMYGFADTFSFDAIKRDYYRSMNEAEEIFKKSRTVTK